MHIQFRNNALKWALLYFVVYFFVIFTFYDHVADVNPPRFPPYNLTLYECPSRISNHAKVPHPKIINHQLPDKRILLVTNRASANYNKFFHDFLKYFKIPVHAVTREYIDRVELEYNSGGRFSLFIFEDYRHYYELREYEKRKLYSYCQKFGAGIVSFLLGHFEDEQFSHFTTTTITNVSAIRFGDSIVNNVAKPLAELPLDSERSNWTTFSTASNNISTILKVSNDLLDNVPVAILIEELNVRHIIFGHALDHWMLKIAFLDALTFTAPNLMKRELQRYVQVDIDDVFLGQKGTKLTPSDVDYLLETQADLKNHIDGFTFLLGFSGYFFGHGDELDSAGDERLVANADKFMWFPHMWRHNHAHELTSDYLQTLMAQNKMFSLNMNLNMTAGYAISPQHGGVYPIYEPLFQSWRMVWNVSVTSTEEYPHFRPASMRRGFIHNGVAILPRQVCGLFTHTLFMHAYPDGVENLRANIFGGELFETILMNKFSIFMTHQQNYASDRLGAFTFRNMVRFISCWTNLQLKWIPPLEMARKYFDEFPDEKRLIYTNPCTDSRHRVILPSSATFCSNLILPNLLILGPQKTGTSALSTFLLLHPNVSTNRPIPKYYEELQFFNSRNYNEGMEWYADKFEWKNDSALSTSQVVFEKSANYFDDVNAPPRIKALLPDATLIVILMDPVDRAYSWYQHMRNHNDSVAARFSAEEVFMSNRTVVQRLRHRCLAPGMYARHFDRWIDHFLPSQLVLIDGDQLRHKPAYIMQELVKRLGLPTNSIDYEKSLQFVSKKGFFCPVMADGVGTVKCLGPAKGRKYPPMTKRLRKFLSAFYEPHNESLKRFLNVYDFSLPTFLI